MLGTFTKKIWSNYWTVKSLESSIICRTVSTWPQRRFQVLDGKLSNSKMELYEHQAEEYKTLYKQKMSQVYAGGGESAIMRHTKRNKKILPRERIQMLVDRDYPLLEIAPFAGFGLDYGDVCSAGNIIVIGKISDQLCIIGASDATVKGGTVFPIGVKKQLRMQEIAAQNNIPCVYVIDSGGGYLPEQANLFIEGGRSFYNEAVMNADGIPQICVVAGSCTAGAAYIPTMAQEVVMVDKIGTIFLAGPPLVYAAIGEKINDQDLGSATVHCEVSGCADYPSVDEIEAFECTKDIMSTLNMEVFLDKNRHVEGPFYDSKDLSVLSIMRDEQDRLDVRKILSRLVDGSRFHEFKPKFGKEILTGFSYLNGILVGIVANNGAFTQQACLKASNFVVLCNERGIPLIFLQDIPSDDDTSTDLIKYQAQLMSSVATSKVPKLTVILGRSFGVGNYSMCGRSMGPRFLFLWPTAETSIEQKHIMMQNNELFGNIETESGCYYSSSRIWDDGVILPEDTRKILSLSLNVCLTYKRVERSSDKSVFRM